MVTKDNVRMSELTSFRSKVIMPSDQNLEDYAVSNIVQVEFFHVGGSATESLEDLFEEMGERVRENLPLALTGAEANPGIKTTLRFYEDGDRLTMAASEIERLKRHHDAILNQYQDSSVGKWRKWNLKNQLQKVNARWSALREDTGEAARSSCISAILSRRPVAIERADRSFRLARPEELHELQEMALQAKGVWFFIFEPNDLLASVNKRVTSLM